MRIVIKLPVNGKFSLSFGHTPRFRKDGTIIFNAIERRLQARGVKEKTAIVVKEGSDTVNESLKSTDARYLLYVAGCFLEEYLSSGVMRRIVRQYSSHSVPYDN
jgi:hypothetical protein